MTTETRIPRRVIIACVARAFGVRVDDLTGYNRSKIIMSVRHVAIALVKEIRPDSSLQDICRLFGGRDHTTAINSLRKAERLLAGYPRIAAQADMAREMCRQWRQEPGTEATDEVAATHVAETSKTPPEANCEPPAAVLEIKRNDEPFEVVDMRRKGAMATERMRALLEGQVWA